MNDEPARDSAADAPCPHRSPQPQSRRLDPERSCRLLLDAALEEFAAKGFAGARVQEIADRAGVNKQLIAYYFGGKEGLWNELGRRWLEREQTFNEPEVPLHELVTRYLHQALDDPRGSRLSAWAGLTGSSPDPEREDLSDLERRKAAGEIADELDPGTVLLLLMSVVSAPVVTPHLVRSILGMDPESPEFRDHYSEQLRRIVRRLG